MRNHSAAADLERMESMGRTRLENENATDAAMLIPPRPAWTKQRKALLIKQLRAMGGQEAVLNHYIELLARTSDLLDFMHHNVGTTEDWPMMLWGESEQAEMHFGDLLGRVEAAVGCLVEVN